MYVRFVGLAKDNPIDELAQHMNCDRETASSRIAEARKRGLLTRPKQGVLGGRLTSKAEKLLGIEKGRK
jgi:predicted transcriptional regulator